MASGMDHRHVRPTTKNDVAQYGGHTPPNTLAHGHEAMVYSVHIWYWTCMLWSTDTVVKARYTLTYTTSQYRGV